MEPAPKRIPLARQAFAVPQLTSSTALTQIMRLVDEFRSRIAAEFPGVELVLVIVDTMNSAAGFENPNDAGEAQKVMELMRAVSRKTGALVLAVDHFGKIIETGVKGSMNKSDAADAILAVMVDKDPSGNALGRRMTQQKLRNGPSGSQLPFKLTSVPIDGWGNTTCVVNWTTIDLNAAEPQKANPSAKPAWSGKLRLLKDCLERMLIEHGTEQQPFGRSGPKVKAVHLERVRTEFLLSYAAESQDAKRKAFKRSLDEARAKNLVATREIGASLVDWIWFDRDTSKVDK